MIQQFILNGVITGSIYALIAIVLLVVINRWFLVVKFRKLDELWNLRVWELRNLRANMDKSR